MPDADNLVLAWFCLLPTAAAVATFLFFFRYQQHREPLRWWRLLSGNLLVLLLVSSLLVLCGEIYYRFLCDSPHTVGRSKITQRWRERHFDYNDAGFRDSVEYQRQVPSGLRRVTFLGDSFTAGHGIADVEKRFANRVRARLDGCDVQTIAEVGWNTEQQAWAASALAADGFPLDLVVLVYCLDDLTDVWPQWQKIELRIYELDRRQLFVQNSYLLNTWHYRRKAARDPELADYFQLMQDGYAGPAWRRQQTRLRELKETVERFDGHLVVVTFPLLHGVGTDACRAAYQQLASFWDELGVAHLDLRSAFQPYRPADLVINRYEPHPNEQAHAVAAEAIAAFLQQQLRATAVPSSAEAAADGP